VSPNEFPDENDRSPNLKLGSLAALIASLLVGVALGLVSLAFSFEFIPTDVARLGVLTRALKSEKPTPELVVFGNSAMMSGFDANAFRESSPDATLAWNCASTGQSLTEAALLTQELPVSVKRVVYALQVRAGPADRLLHPNKFNTFYMSGLRPTDDTAEILRSLRDAEMNELLEDTWLEQVVASRWAVRQLIDRLSRRFLRSDLELEKATVDLFHPQAYSQPIKASITAAFIAGRTAGYAQKPAMLPAETLTLAQALAERGAAAGRETIFLFPPSHPSLFAPNQAAISRVIEDFAAQLRPTPKTTVLNAIDLLPETDFIDDMHPTNAGAVTPTDYLAQALRGTDRIRAQEQGTS
jgi:hypothetical protein